MTDDDGGARGIGSAVVPTNADLIAATIHDLRQPLQTCGLLRGLLALRAADGHAAALFARLDDALASMTTILDTLSQVNQIESGGAGPEITDVRVDTLLDRLRADFAAAAEAEGTILRIVPCRRSIRGDPGLLLRMLHSMVSAAVKGTGPGTVLLGCRRRGGMLRLEVLTRGDAAGADGGPLGHHLRHPGDGQGMAMARYLGHLLGHPLLLGEAGFAVEVPLGHDEPATRRLPPPGPFPVSPPGRAGDGRTIFVIDDNQPLRDALHDLLVEYGWEVEAWPSADAFLTADTSRRQGILLVDAVMPGMGGLELLRRLRDQRRQLPAIVMTGHGDMAMVVEAIKAGARDFIEKPIECEDLLAALDRIREVAPASARPGAGGNAIAGMTARERQVVDMVLAGHPSKRIAHELGISQRTVESHRSTVMKKAGVKSLAALIRVALALE